MVKRLLVTTAIEETWDSEKPMLFLGEWCKLYKRKTYWEKLDFLVAPYHWDDRELLKSNYIYLDDFYETTLKSVSLKLNEIHNVNFSNNYWRIIVGPWLCEFIQILFDRYTMLEIAFNNYTIENVKLINHTYLEGIPKDINEFNKFITEDSWNELIFGEIIKYLNKSKIDWINKSFFVEIKNNKLISNSNFILSTKKIIYKSLDFISGLFVKDSEYFFLSTYLPKKFELLLQIKLKQFPKIWNTQEVSYSKVDISIRESITLIHKSKNDFETLIQKILFKYIPVCYLEGFKNIQNTITNLNWPINPKVIFTSNKFFNDELFKMWAAEKSDKGIPLILGQHGGCYGVADFISSEEHELKIADVYLTWGWENKFNQKILPLFNFKIIGKKINWNPNGKLFLVTMALPRYSYSIYAIPIASQFLYYLNDQFSFITFLSPMLQNQLILRLFPQDFGWEQEKRIKDKFPSICIDNSKVPIYKKMNEIRLYVSTYNATTFLESLSLNVPTIMFWDFKFWEIRNDAKQYYQELISVGILHDSPESAADKINEIWNDVESWWESREIQNARINFCSRFSREVNEPIKLLQTSLSTISELRMNYRHGTTNR